MTLVFSTPGSRYSFPEKEPLVPGMRYVSMGSYLLGFSTYSVLSLNQTK